MEQLKCCESIEGETWKTVQEYENRYLISDYGRVYSITKCIIRKQTKAFGYYTISLYKNTKPVKFRIHRLVAQAFIHNSDPEKFTKVNHLDNDGMNNKKENLEWTDTKGNTDHAVKNGHLKKEGRSVIQMDLDENDIREFGSILEASRETGVSTPAIKRCCSGRVKNPRKFKWKYKEVVNKEKRPKGKKIRGYSIYILTLDGKVYNKQKKLYLKPIYPKRGGYPYYSLYGNKGEHKNLTIHRLLGKYYLDNEDHPCVNHKDGDKCNYEITNLEWLTYKENSQHAVDTGLNKHSKGVIRSDIETGEELEKYKSITDACRELELSDAQRKHISGVCKGTRKSTAGYSWKYA